MLFSASFALSRNPWKHLAAEPKNTQSPITQERPTTPEKGPRPFAYPVPQSGRLEQSTAATTSIAQTFRTNLAKFLNAQNHPFRWQHTRTRILPLSPQSSFQRCRSRTLLPSNARGVYQAARRLFDKHKPFRLRMAALSGIAPRKWKISSQECRCTILR